MFKKSNYLILILLLGLAEDIHTSSIKQSINDHKKQFSNVALEIWNHAEMGYQETKSSNLLASELEKEGFKVTKNVANIPTAFIAEYGSSGMALADEFYEWMDPNQLENEPTFFFNEHELQELFYERSSDQ